MEERKWSKEEVEQMPVIVLALHERWWWKMLAGEKKLEIRKNKPQTKGAFKVLVYITGSGCVAGEFICPEVIEFSDYREITKRSCVPLEQLDEYGRGKKLKGWEIAQVQQYDEWKPLQSFGIYRAPQSWQYLRR